jgi:RNA polymerase sigma-70 factor (ECF subfamily)
MQSGDVDASDAELVKQAIAGHRQAFDTLIRRYQRQAVAVSYRLLGRQEDALEVTQDAFLKAYTSLATLQQPAAFGGWLMRIVSNLSLNYRRSRKNRSQLPLDALLSPGGDESAGQEPLGGDRSAIDDPARLLAGRELGVALAEAMAKLPPKQRLALVMFTLDEMPQKQIAEALECSIEAVKWHVFQGRKKLRELLKDQLQD